MKVKLIRSRYFHFLILLFYIFSPCSIFSEGFDQGKIIFFLGGAKGLSNNRGSLEDHVEEFNYPKKFVRNEEVNSPNYFRDYFFYDDYINQTTRLTSNSREVGFEYGVFRYLGIGLSASDQTITSSRFASFDRQFISIFGPPSSNSNVIITERLDIANKSSSVFFRSTTADLSFFIHFLPNFRWDPFFRIGGGSGIEQYFGGKTNRLFSSIGLRYHISQNFFISAELEHSNVYIVDYTPPIQGYKNRGNFEESFFRGGVGLSFQLGNGSEEISNKDTNSVLKSELKSNERLATEINHQNLPKNLKFLASEIIDLYDSTIHLEGRTIIDSIARKLNEELKEYDVIIVTTTTPYRNKQEVSSDNYDIGIERSRAISKLLIEKNVNGKRIFPSTKGSENYNLDSRELVIFEFRKKN